MIMTTEAMTEDDDGNDDGNVWGRLGTTGDGWGRLMTGTTEDWSGDDR